MSKSILVFIVSSFLMLTSSPHSSIATDDFQSFIGEWKGTGTLFGSASNFKMSWKKTVNDKFIELNFENAFKTADGSEQKLTAKAVYWFIDNENLKGHWYDSRGVVFPLEATFQNNVLTSLWGDDSSVERGKTVYKLIDKTSISAEDFVWRNEKMTPFGAATYQRK